MGVRSRLDKICEYDVVAWKIRAAAYFFGCTFPQSNLITTMFPPNTRYGVSGPDPDVPSDGYTAPSTHARSAANAGNQNAETEAGADPS